MPPDPATDRPSDQPARRRPHRGLRYRPTSVMMASVLVAVASACGGTTPPSPSPSSAASASTPTPSFTSAADPWPTPSASSAPTQGIGAELDGMPRNAQLAAREPIALTIDDSVTSRPNQAGFDQASIVYQGPAEGGEMKYMMVFQEGDASRIGPLRSGRPHFAAWAAEYRAIFAHFGGDSHLLSWLPSLNRTLLYDISFIVDPGSSRDPSLPRPHNAFTSTARIREVAAAKGYPATLTAGLAVRPFVDDLPAAQRPTSGSISAYRARAAPAFPAVGAARASAPRAWAMGTATAIPRALNVPVGLSPS